MDVKCPGCYKITTVFSHAQRVVVCAGCSTILCQPTGGRARLTEGESFLPYINCYCVTPVYYPCETSVVVVIQSNNIVSAYMRITKKMAQELVCLIYIHDF